MNAVQVRNVRQMRPEMERQRTSGNTPQRVYMSKMRKRRKARRARKAKAFAAVVILWLMEVSMAAAAGAVVAAIIVPLALLERGYFSLGGEWALVLAATLLAYHFIHKAVFRRLES